MFKHTEIEFDGSVKVFTQGVKALEVTTKQPNQDRHQALVRKCQPRDAAANDRYGIHPPMLAAGPGGVRSPNAKRPGFVSNVLQQAASNMLTDLLGSVVGSALGMGGAAAGAAGAAGEVTGPARGARGACPEVQGGSRLGRVLRLGASATAAAGLAGAGAAAVGQGHPGPHNAVHAHARALGREPIKSGTCKAWRR